MDTHTWLREVCQTEPLSITARGECMSPLIADGAVLRIAPGKRYYPGDILVCRTGNGNYRVHRLLGSARWRGRKRYVTRGDNSAQVDGRIDAGQILGRVEGGDCDHRAVAIPLGHRLMALTRFARFALARFTQ
jgi:hypothetical protein